MGLGILTSLISPVANYFEKKQERKKEKEAAEAKLRLAKANNDHKLELTDSEWESLSLDPKNESFKDEYLTVIITLWIPMIFIGAIYSAFTGETKILDGVNMALKTIAEMGIDMGKLTEIVVLAGVGLKLWRGK